MSRILFRPSGIALAVAASLLTPGAFASEINYKINDSNLEVVDPNPDEESGLTWIYPDANKTPGTERGYILIDRSEGDDKKLDAPGMGAYTVDYFADQKTEFQGCIMSSKGEPDGTWTNQDSCKLGPDSGKRFKLRATKLDQPMDIVFDLKETGFTNLYNVFGKFSNYTGQDAKGFSVQVGTGIGDAFKELPGVELAGGEDELGKFPGGLFGGSAVEGLPFFSPNPEHFKATDASLATEHTRTVTGLPSGQGGGDGIVKTLFGSWLSVEDVPEAWTYDEDGLPWTDNVLAAVDLDGEWTTYRKTWTKDEYVLRKEGVSHTFSLDDYTSAVNLRDPDYLDPTRDEPKIADLKKLAKAINTDKGTDFKPQDLAHGLAKILEITPSPVSPVAMGWADNPPTVVVPAVAEDEEDTLVATWNAELGDEGMYVVEEDYRDRFDGASEVSMDEMRPFVFVAGENEADDLWEARAGWVKEEVEDLANVNTSYAIRVNENVTGQLTMRVWVFGDSKAVTPPRPDTSGGTSSSGGGGCTIGGSGTPDPALPAMVALGLGMLGWRRLRSRKQG